MKNIRDLLSKKKIGETSEVDEKTIESVFFDVLGKESKNVERSDIWEVRMKGKKILVRTIHPAIASEIWRKREKIKNRINEELGNEAVEEIKVK